MGEIAEKCDFCSVNPHWWPIKEQAQLHSYLRVIIGAYRNAEKIQQIAARLLCANVTISIETELQWNRAICVKNARLSVKDLISSSTQLKST